MKLSDRLAGSQGNSDGPNATPPNGRTLSEMSKTGTQPESTSFPPAGAPVPGSPLGGNLASPPIDALAGLKQRAALALFDRLGTRFGDTSSSDEELRTIAVDELSAVIDEEQVPLSPEERRRLIREIADEVMGLGPLQRLLEDPSVTEIMVNRFDQIYIERNGHLSLTGSQFSSDDHLRKVIERIVSKVGRRIDESSPLVDARLEDGSRVNAIIPPLAVGGSSLTIRKFSKVPLRVRNLIDFGTL